MQEKAEEKRKGYACVVWTADKVTDEKLSQLEGMCTSGATRDEDGISCIEVLTVCYCAVIWCLQCIICGYY